MYHKPKAEILSDWEKKKWEWNRCNLHIPSVSLYPELENWNMQNSGQK